MRVPKIRQKGVEHPVEYTGTENHEKLDLAAEEKYEYGDCDALDQGPSHCEQDALNRMHPENSERIERGRTVMNLVERPKNRNAMQHSMNDVARKIVQYEQAQGEGDHDQPLGDHVRCLGTTRKQPVHPLEDQIGDRSLSEQSRRKRRHHHAVDGHHAVICPCGCVPPACFCENLSNRPEKRKVLAEFQPQKCDRSS